MLDLGERIITTLRELFGNLPEFVHRLQQDTRAIGGLVEGAKREAQEREERNKEITASYDIGMFKHKLSISTEGVEWRNEKYPLTTITRVRWGGTRHSLNGIPTGSTYHIWFGDENRISKVEPNKLIYEHFTERLWKAVVPRLAFELVEGLKGGRRFQFGDTTITDTGVEIIQRGFWAPDKPVIGKWKDVRIGNDAGCFVLGLASDKGALSSLSYQDIDNVHVLEMILRLFFKKGGDRLSEAFQD